MVRRWSCLNNFSFTFNFNTFFITRFDIFKLARAVNYKKFIIGTTKFNRHKLTMWKRNSSWLPYASIFKFWIRDYGFNKKLIKSQFSDFMFLNNFIIFNFNYIKKKNILRTENFTNFFFGSLSKFFLKYFNNKYFDKNLLLFLKTSTNVNYNWISSFDLNPLSALSLNSLEPSFVLFIKTQNELFSPNVIGSLNKSPIFLLKTLSTLSSDFVLHIYKLFIFFFYYVK